MLNFNRETSPEKGEKSLLSHVAILCRVIMQRRLFSQTPDPVCFIALQVKFNLQSENYTLFFTNEYVRCNNNLYLSDSSLKHKKTQTKLLSGKC